MVLWQEIKNKIELDIIAGVYHQVDQAKMPSITELANKYNCGKSTAQKVLDELCIKGILLSKQGVGYFIKPYAKQHLYDEKISLYENKLSDLITDMKSFNISKEVLSEMVNATINNIYS